MRLVLFSIVVFLLTTSDTIKIYSQPTNNHSSWAYDILNIPKAEKSNKPSRPIVIAVIDDGFRLTHKELKDFIYQNPLEIPDNQLDDDGNNYTDDINGWDISDDDADVSVQKGKEYELFHGTYIASIITQIAKRYYGDDAFKYIRIMPVKVISDFAAFTYIKDGYKGIKYAIDNGADIICLAWSGGELGKEDKQILEEAKKKNILLVGAAGNFWEDKVYNPANSPEVMAVAAIDSTLHKFEKSNFGMKIDLSAPGQYVYGAHPEKDNAYIFEDGTSSATAIIAAAAGILLSVNPKLTADEIRKVLINTSTPFPSDFNEYGGKLGSGIINIGNAIEYANPKSDKEKSFSSLRPKGSFSISQKTKTTSYEIKPAGAYHGFYVTFKPKGINKKTKQTLSILTHDSLLYSYSIGNLPPQIFVPFNSLRIDYKGSKLTGKESIEISYSGKTIDSTTLFCRDTKYYTEDRQTIDDGSGDADYANNCSCKWIITAPPGKTIKFIFDRIDTQANIDFIYLVDGTTAIPSNFIAKFSGQNLPPIVYSRTNEVLVWFVTDKYITGKGWQFHYEFVDNKK